MLRRLTILSATAALTFSLCTMRIAAQGLPPAQKPFEPKVPQGTGACSIDRPCAEVAPLIISSALGASPLENNLRELTDVIGGRVAGTPANDKAVEWAVEAFRRAGVDEVHTERFTVPVSWAEGHTHLEVIAPEALPVHLVSIGWSPATPAGGITASMVDAGIGDEAGFARLGNAASGAIVLVHTNVLKTWDDLMNEYNYEPAVIDRAVKAGAAAILWMSTRPYMLLYRHNLSVTGELERLPQAVVAREDAMRLARFIASGQPVKVRLDMPNKIGGPVQSENVVAEIRGSVKPDEFVLLGAHLDSWELGTGALDDGCNAAMTIDAARAIRAAGAIPKRSIRFVLFSGEEEGMLGSRAYAAAHRAELDQMDTTIIFDSGDGKVTGYSLGGRKDIAATVTRALEPLSTFGPFENTDDADLGTDNFDFLLEGVPTLVANQEPDDYIMNYHAASDTFDKVDFAQLKRNEAIAAVTAYAVADLPEKLGARQNREQIEKLLEDTGLKKEMQAAGAWPLWVDGRRGRRLTSSSSGQ
ncbi:MAG TPA: M20/M25/M40 family metallo-hydrolase [Candidatus Acidoferrales bacterium]|nr:M20/M25/M40 family metallo-hydrolase [Candidatus Acidoferrales bacterium]